MSRGDITEPCRIEPGTDLHALLAVEIARHQADGWHVEGDGKWGVFFMTRNGERREVALVRVDPADDGAHLRDAVRR